MQQTVTLPATDKLVPLELLSEDELSTISGGLTPFMMGAAIAGGALGAALGGVVVGVAFYYFTRE